MRTAKKRGLRGQKHQIIIRYTQVETDCFEIISAVFLIFNAALIFGTNQ